MAQHIPGVLEWFKTCYCVDSVLVFHDSLLYSRAGFRQGDAMASNKHLCRPLHPARLLTQSLRAAEAAGRDSGATIELPVDLLPALSESTGEQMVEPRRTFSLYPGAS